MVTDFAGGLVALRRSDLATARRPSFANVVHFHWPNQDYSSTFRHHVDAVLHVIRQRKKQALNFVTAMTVPLLCVSPEIRTSDLDLDLREIPCFGRYKQIAFVYAHPPIHIRDNKALPVVKVTDQSQLHFWGAYLQFIPVIVLMIS